jgi:4-hydroxybenzoate polyprenyltransferase
MPRSRSCVREDHHRRIEDELCGLQLSGAHADVVTTSRIILGMSSLYAFGMVLNDLCDEAHDRRHRPDRPLPAGAISTAAATGSPALALVAVGCACTTRLAKGQISGT